MRAEEFFEHFEANGMAGEDEGGPRTMLKLKDFPPNGSFSQHLGRHAQVGTKSDRCFRCEQRSWSQKLNSDVCENFRAGLHLDGSSLQHLASHVQAGLVPPEPFQHLPIACIGLRGRFQL